MLHELGLVDQHVRLQVYPHVLASTADVVEWVKGTTLARFARRLAPEAYDRFVADDRVRLFEVMGDRAPGFFPFTRVLFVARRA